MEIFIPIDSLRSCRGTLIWRFIMLQSSTDEYDTSVIALPSAPALAVLPMR